MKVNLTFKLIFLSVLIIFLFFGTFLIFAQDDNKEEEIKLAQQQCVPCPQHYYYECTASCDGTLRDWWWEPCCTGRAWIQSQKNCESWEKCDAGIGQCYCSGDCLDQPTLIYPPNGVEKERLPVPMQWTEVDGANYYRYSVDGIGGVVAPPWVTIRDCTLKSNKSYNWKTRACCDPEGTDCGSWSSTWSFKTSLAPELLSPEENATDVPIPTGGITLDWCDVEHAQSWLLKAYLIENGGETCHPWLISENSCNPWPIRPERRPPPYDPGAILYSEFLDKEGVFTKDTKYRWEIATCLREDGADCSEFSQRWKFATLGDLSTFKLISPPNDPGGNKAVGLPVVLDWEDKPGINSFVYEISSIGAGTTPYSQLTLDYPQLSLDTTYDWQVKPCWDYGGEECEEDWSEKWYFRTTGAPPQLNSPAPSASDVPIPIELDWEDIDGAKSYKYEVHYERNQIFEGKISGNPPFSEISIEYDLDKKHPKPKTNYSWQVKTCADNEGEVCGDWSERSFTTFTLSPPTNPDPENNGEFLTSENYLRWEGAAKYYRYEVDQAGSQIIPPTNVSRHSAFIPTEELELGEYSWHVQACLDRDCQETSQSGGPWYFTLVQEECKKGLVPCGRDCNVAETPWNERDSCQFKHIFLLLKNILDFILWRLGLIVLVLLAIATGVIYYFSMGAPTTMVKVKSLLQSAGKGYGIILLAWIITNLVLAILGFQVSVFGRWWEITF